MLPNLSALQLGPTSIDTKQSWWAWLRGLDPDEEPEPQAPDYDFLEYNPPPPEPSQEEYENAMTAFNEELNKLEDAIRTFYAKYATTERPMTQEEFAPIKQDQSDMIELIEKAMKLQKEFNVVFKNTPKFANTKRKREYRQAYVRFCYYERFYCKPIVSIVPDKTRTVRELLPPLQKLHEFQCPSKRLRGLPNPAAQFGETG